VPIKKIKKIIQACGRKNCIFFPSPLSQQTIKQSERRENIKKKRREAIS
jgi:hypothetical protein